jgi:hypothetical protein
MYKVFESFDLSHVGQLQSMLESHGIRTFIKNQYASSVMGEVPFIEICPQLYVLKAHEVERALQLLQMDAPTTQVHEEDWVCARCGGDGPRFTDPAP